MLSPTLSICLFYDGKTLINAYMDLQTVCPHASGPTEMRDGDLECVDGEWKTCWFGGFYSSAFAVLSVGDKVYLPEMIIEPSLML